MTRLTTVNGTFNMSMQTMMLTTMIPLLKSCGILWEIICLNVSISFVYTDMISP